MDSPDLWLPINEQPYLFTGSKLFTDFSVDGKGVRMWGRLRTGLNATVAEDELQSLVAELRRQHPNDIWEKERLRSRPGGYAQSMQNGGRHGTGTEPQNELIPVATLVCSLVLLILAVACGNLGSLLLARGVAREREITIRVAVGAGRSRLVHQLFTESLLLALLGSVAGLALGYVVLRSLMALTDTPGWLNPTPDWRVIVFAIGIGFVAAILFGLTPALQIVRHRHRTTIVRQIMIGAQVAASCVLLIVAGLLIRALDRATTANPGFEYRQVISIDPGLASHGYSPASARAFLDTLQGRLRALPGVEAVSLASPSPLGRGTVVASVHVDGRATDIHMSVIDPQFFHTMQIPLLSGRNLMRGDGDGLVVSESLTRRLWPAQDSLGKQLFMDGVNRTVVGVVGNARLVALQDPDAVEAYYLANAANQPSMVVLVKASGPPEGLVPFLASMAKSVDPGIFPEVQLLKVSFREKLKGAGYSALAVVLLGFIALLLACLGVAGVVAYAVSQRTKEIGLRMALGAKPLHVVSIVLRQFSLPVAAGLLAGVAGAGALSQILRRQLYGVSNLDPTAYLAAVGIFIVTVALSALLPTRQALRIDPMRALRQD